MSDVRAQLMRLVEEARESCVVEHVPRYELLQSLGSEEEKTEFLWGSCIQNAEILKQHIERKTDYPTFIVKGGLDIPREPTPKTHDEALSHGTVHHWVAVETGEGLYHCDVACEDYESGYGEPFVCREPPREYIEF